MHNNIGAYISILLFSLLVITNGQAQQFPSMNNQVLGDSSLNSFSFLVGGHLYGSSKINSGLPASTVLAAIDLMNDSGVHFLASLGDIFSNVKKDIPATKKAFIDRLQFPIFNAVGDHDMTSSSNIYQETFGRPYFYFFYQRNLFIFLDTDTDDSSIKGEQLKLLKQALSEFGTKSQNVFLFSHRPIWSETNQQLQHIFVNNNRASFGCNYDSEVLPLLNTIPQNTKIYWFSGSMGAANIAYFYHAENEQQHFIQTAVKDSPYDGILKVNVNQGKTSIETISLTSAEAEAIDYYNLDYWKANAGKAAPYSLNDLKTMLVHRYFWYGAGLMFLGIVSLIFLAQIILRKKV